MCLSNGVPRPSAVLRACVKGAAMLAIEGQPVTKWGEISINSMLS
jgi:hypothetical protein